jgi:uncharacterized protein (DUF2384 family)
MPRQPSVGQAGSSVVDTFPLPARSHATAITAQSIKRHALDTFGTSKKADHWLNRPNPLFDGKTPLQVVRIDPSSVEAALVRIDYGVYV